MIRVKSPSRVHISEASLQSEQARDNRNQKYCPVCGREAGTKYFDDSRKVWVYSHPQRFKPTVRHEAPL